MSTDKESRTIKKIPQGYSDWEHCSNIFLNIYYIKLYSIKIKKVHFVTLDQIALEELFNTF